MSSRSRVEQLRKAIVNANVCANPWGFAGRGQCFEGLGQGSSRGCGAQITSNLRESSKVSNTTTSMPESAIYPGIPTRGEQLPRSIGCVAGFRTSPPSFAEEELTRDALPNPGIFIFFADSYPRHLKIAPHLWKKPDRRLSI